MLCFASWHPYLRYFVTSYYLPAWHCRPPRIWGICSQILEPYIAVDTIACCRRLRPKSTGSKMRSLTAITPTETEHHEGAAQAPADCRRGGPRLGRVGENTLHSDQGRKSQVDSRTRTVCIATPRRIWSDPLLAVTRRSLLRPRTPPLSLSGFHSRKAERWPTSACGVARTPATAACNRLHYPRRYTPVHSPRARRRP